MTETRKAGRPKRNEKPQDDCTTALNSMLEPFAWKVCVHGSNGIDALSDDERKQLMLVEQNVMLNRISREVNYQVPDAFWRIVLIPPDVVRHFEKINDARALAIFLGGSVRSLKIWRLASVMIFTDAQTQDLLQDSFAPLPAAAHTSSGAVYQSCDAGVQKVWFGKKAGREKTPDLQGHQLLQAVRALFRIPSPIDELEGTDKS